MLSSNTTPTSVDDVLARMKAAGNLSFDLPDDVAIGTSDLAMPGEKIVSIHAAPTTSVPSNAHRGPGHEPHAHEDLDVQEYMNRLLKRSASSQPTSVSENPPVAAASAQPAPVVVEKSTQAMTPEEFIPKTVAPEKKASLNAFRELANHSNRAAIATSVKQRHRANKLTYLALAIAILGFSVLFMFMSAKLFDVSMLAGFASFAIALVPLFRFVRLSRSTNSKAKS